MRRYRMLKSDSGVPIAAEQGLLLVWIGTSQLTSDNCEDFEESVGGIQNAVRDPDERQASPSASELTSHSRHPSDDVVRHGPRHEAGASIRAGEVQLRKCVPGRGVEREASVSTL